MHVPLLLPPAPLATALELLLPATPPAAATAAATASATGPTPPPPLRLVLVCDEALADITLPAAQTTPQGPTQLTVKRTIQAVVAAFLDALASPGGPAARVDVCVCVGPEGGWSQRERERMAQWEAQGLARLRRARTHADAEQRAALLALGCLVRVGLGPSILRADTAATVALATALQLRWQRDMLE
jgi:hypothetical protein